MRIGLVCNPFSGGQNSFGKVLQLLQDKLVNHEVVCTYATSILLPTQLPHKVVGDKKVHGTPIDSVIAGQILSDVDLVIVLGGDGTISDVVFGQHLAGKFTPVAGIALGTINAGPLIVFRKLDDLSKLSLEKFSTKPVMGLGVYDNDGQLVGIAFNDVVFSDCTVSSVNGKVCTVEAASYLKGKRLVASPKIVGTALTEVRINRKIVKIPFDVGQIVASPLHEPGIYQGKALFGKLCWAPHLGMKWSMIVTNEPIIRIVDAHEVETSSPLLMAQFIFKDEDSVLIKNTRGFVVIDGNPRLNMEVSKACTLRLIQNAALGCVFK